MERYNITWTEIKCPLERVHAEGIKIRSVNENHEKFKELVDSIKIKGVTDPPFCRPAVDPAEKTIIDGHYALIDGGHRRKAAELAGLTTLTIRIPAEGFVVSDELALQIQLQNNKYRVPQGKKDERNHILAYASDHPDKTPEDLANEYGMTTATLKGILAFNNLIPEVADAFEKGTITLSHAREMTRCPNDKYPGLQALLLDDAIRLSSADFTTLAQQKRKEIKTGDTPSKGPVASYRKRLDVEQKLEGLQNTLETNNFETAADISAQDHFLEMRDLLLWVLRLDPQSLKERERKETKRAKTKTIKETLAERDSEIQELRKLLAAQGLATE